MWPFLWCYSRKSAAVTTLHAFAGFVPLPASPELGVCKQMPATHVCSLLEQSRLHNGMYCHITVVDYAWLQLWRVAFVCRLCFCWWWAFSWRVRSVLIAAMHSHGCNHMCTVTTADAHTQLWLRIDVFCMSTGGDSAGGNLTAATLLLTKQRGGAPIAFQLLIYPTVHSASQSESRQKFAKGFALDKTVSRWMYTSYVGGESPNNPLISPLMAEDLSFMPPAFVVTATHDPLRDEGRLYAERLQKEGVRCSHTCYEGMLHGFLNHTYMLPLDVGEQAVSDCAKHLRDALHTPAGKL